uniref:Uncharacterized protein n=1 Tax=Spermophilus dauricus TaxID=99837 RepID=A0A8C9UVI9_SPEDA
MSSNNDQVVIPMLRRHTNGLPEMISADGETITQGAVLSFHNICYRGQEKRGSLFRQRTVEKEILSNISGIMKPGLNAIMGPPGGDESLLLDILAARKDPCGLSGEVLINGVHQPANFRYNSGYVVQVSISEFDFYVSSFSIHSLVIHVLVILSPFYGVTLGWDYPCLP